MFICLSVPPQRNKKKDPYLDEFDVIGQIIQKMDDCWVPIANHPILEMEPTSTTRLVDHPKSLLNFWYMVQGSLISCSSRLLGTISSDFLWRMCITVIQFIMTSSPTVKVLGNSAGVSWLCNSGRGPNEVTHQFQYMAVYN